MGANNPGNNRQANFIIYSVELTASEAKNGCTREVLFDGQKYTLNIPAGTKDGDMIDMRTRNDSVIGTAVISVKKPAAGFMDETANRRKILIWIAVGLVVAALVIVLLSVFDKKPHVAPPPEEKSSEETTSDDVVADEPTQEEDGRLMLQEFARNQAEEAGEYIDGYPVYEVIEGSNDEPTVKIIAMCCAIDDFDGDDDPELIELFARGDFDQQGEPFWGDPFCWYPYLKLYEISGSEIREDRNVELPPPLFQNTHDGTYYGHDKVISTFENAAFISNKTVVFYNVNVGGYDSTIVTLLTDEYDSFFNRSNSQESVVYQRDGGSYIRSLMTAQYIDDSIDISAEQYENELDTLYRKSSYIRELQPEFITPDY
ncbi:MAG: hypothetical protein IKG25_06575 [Mogibacterium sp.]|nr:hypothetical protein [Mogibacterium sp.]MBR4091370.1 hypothetical protein [Mogibacterium sp.]